jgi:hypothetical protein
MNPSAAFFARVETDNNIENRDARNLLILLTIRCPPVHLNNQNRWPYRLLPMSLCGQRYPKQFGPDCNFLKYIDYMRLC